MEKPLSRNLFASTNRFSFVALFFVLVLYCGCQPNSEKSQTTNIRQSSLIQEPEKPILTQEIEQTEEPVYYTSGKISKSVSTKKDNIVKTAFTIREQFIDSLNKILPIYDKEKYNKLSVTYFTSLASHLGGRTFFADNADSLTNSIMDILSSRLDDGTDIVFLIDKTGSMEDDLDKVKSSMNVIIDYLAKFQNVKLGIASYGDKNYQYDFWYNRMDLSIDIDQIKSYMNSYTIIGNPDIPESVNDAIVRTVRETNWTEGNKRLMLVIGDAPSQEPPLSGYTEKEVIAVCDSMNVKFNLYPIILAISPQGQIDTPFRSDFVKTYPNPATTILNVDFDSQDFYSIALHDISGKSVLQKTVDLQNSVIDVSGIANGTYLLQIHNGRLDKYYTSKLTIQH
jgi:hypothetical protein